MQVGTGLDPWLVTGLVMGGVAVVVIVGTFLASERLFTDPRDRESGENRSETRRREEIRYYLQAIDEPYEEDVEVAGHRVAFFLPDRDVAVTFDARAFLRIRDSEHACVLCEHEMPGSHLGDRLPFETPDLGPEDDEDRTRDDRGRDRRRATAGGESVATTADPERVGASFAMLGLRTGASEREVREAYRRRVKDTHPDHGGDRETFQRLQDAYDVAREHAE